MIESLQGTDFQIMVWKEIAKIPSGQTRTYKELAEILVDLKVPEQ